MPNFDTICFLHWADDNSSSSIALQGNVFTVFVFVFGSDITSTHTLVAAAIAVTAKHFRAQSFCLFLANNVSLSHRRWSQLSRPEVQSRWSSGEVFFSLSFHLFATVDPCAPTFQIFLSLSSSVIYALSVCAGGTAVAVATQNSRYSIHTAKILYISSELIFFHCFTLVLWTTKMTLWFVLQLSVQWFLICLSIQPLPVTPKIIMSTEAHSTQSDQAKQSTDSEPVSVKLNLPVFPHLHCFISCSC